MIAELVELGFLQLALNGGYIELVQQETPGDGRFRAVSGRDLLEVPTGWGPRSS